MLNKYVIKIGFAELDRLSFSEDDFNNSEEYFSGLLHGEGNVHVA